MLLHNVTDCMNVVIINSSSYIALFIPDIAWCPRDGLCSMITSALLHHCTNQRRQYCRKTFWFNHLLDQSPVLQPVVTSYHIISSVRNGFSVIWYTTGFMTYSLSYDICWYTAFQISNQASKFVPMKNKPIFAHVNQKYNSITECNNAETQEHGTGAGLLGQWIQILLSQATISRSPVQIFMEPRFTSSSSSAPLLWQHGCPRISAFWWLETSFQFPF